MHPVQSKSVTHQRLGALLSLGISFWLSELADKKGSGPIIKEINCNCWPSDRCTNAARLQCLHQLGLEHRVGNQCPKALLLSTIHLPQEIAFFLFKTISNLKIGLCLMNYHFLVFTTLQSSPLSSKGQEPGTFC